MRASSKKNLHELKKIISNENTLLHYAAMYNPDVVPLLLEANANPNLKNDLGSTPLHISAVLSPSAIFPLLNAKANPNFEDNNGYVPLSIAINNNPETIPLFLNAGADVKQLKHSFLLDSFTEKYAFLLYVNGYNGTFYTDSYKKMFDKETVLNKAFEVYYKLYKTEWENAEKSSSKSTAAGSSDGEFDLAEPTTPINFSEKTLRLIMEYLYDLPTNHKIYKKWSVESQKKLN